MTDSVKSGDVVVLNSDSGNQHRRMTAGKNLTDNAVECYYLDKDLDVKMVALNKAALTVIK